MMVSQISSVIGLDLEEVMLLSFSFIWMSQCKKDVTPLLTHWSYIFLALTHRYGTLVYYTPLCEHRTAADILCGPGDSYVCVHGSCCDMRYIPPKLLKHKDCSTITSILRYTLYCHSPLGLQPPMFWASPESSSIFLFAFTAGHIDPVFAWIEKLYFTVGPTVWGFSGNHTGKCFYTDLIIFSEMFVIHDVNK